MPTSINEAEVLAAFEAARVARTKRVLVGSHGIEIPSPFPSPEDWRDQWIYFLMIDRFNNPQAAPQPTSVPYDSLVGEFRGGSFNGVRAQLDYLKELGCWGDLAVASAEELPVQSVQLSRLWHSGLRAYRSTLRRRPRGSEN